MRFPGFTFTFDGLVSKPPFLTEFTFEVYLFTSAVFDTVRNMGRPYSVIGVARDRATLIPGPDGAHQFGRASLGLGRVLC